MTSVKRVVSQWMVLLGLIIIFWSVVIPALILILVLEAIPMPALVAGLVFLLFGVPIIFFFGFLGLGLAMRMDEWASK